MIHKNGINWLITHSRLEIGTHHTYVCAHRVIQSNFNIIFYQIYFSIADYSTASTDESVLIIGGLTYRGSPPTISVIAEYKNRSWTNIGNLAQPRYGHGSITSGSVTMVVGGWAYNSGST